MITQSNLQRADWDELLFRHRNKQYGAYVLRRQYASATIRGLALASAALIGLCMIPLVQAWLKGPDVALPPKYNGDREVVVDTRSKLPDLPKERQPVAQAANQRPTVAHNTPTVVEDVRANPENTLPQQSDFANADPGATTQAGDPNGQPVGSPEGTGVGTELASVPEPEPDAPIFAEQLPVALNLDRLRRSMGYPAQAIEAGIEGIVVLRVLVDAEGKYLRHIVIRSPHTVLTKAVEAKIGQLHFSPAMQGGRQIKCWVIVPFRFKLNH